MSAFVAWQHALIYLRARRSREHLSFASLAATMAFYQLCAAALYSAATPAAARPWQLAQVATLLLGAVALAWFVSDYTGQAVRRFLVGLACGLIVAGIVVAVGGTRLVFTDAPAVKRVALPFGLDVTYNEVEAGPLAWVVGILGFAVFVWVFPAAVRQFRAGERRRATHLLVAMGVFFVGVVNDMAIVHGGLGSIYLLEYAFMGMVVLMAQVLTGELVRAGTIEAALRESERNYREVFDATSDAIFVHDAETGAILDVNQTMLDLFGYRRDELLTLAAANLAAQQPPFTPVEALTRIRKAITEGPQVFEWLARKKDGTEFWVEVALRGSLIGGKQRVLAAVRDITERRRAAEALRLSEERFRSLVQQAYDFITVHGPDGTILEDSPAARRVLGYGAGELAGRNAFELVHPDDLPVVREAFGLTLKRANTGIPTEYRVRRADGRWIDIETLAQNLLDNPAVGGIVLTSRDISERKRVEAELRRQLDELTVLNAVARAAVETDDEEQLLGAVTEIVRNALFPDDCGFLLVDEDTGELRYSVSYRANVADLDRSPIPPGAGVTGRVVATGEPLRVDDLSTFGGYVARLQGMKSEICVPMKIGARVIGVINAESARPAAFSVSDERILGTVAGVVASAIGRLRAAAAHRASEERFRRLAESAFEGIGITDEGRIVDVNTRLAEMLGYQPAEMIGRPVLDFVAAESAGAVAGYLAEAKDEVYEHLAIRKDGSVFPVETQGKPLPGCGGGMRVAAIRDVTERRAAEQRIRRQLERLAALREIDIAIAGGLALTDTLNVFLDKVMTQLQVDAAIVLLFDPATRTLAHAASRGFRTDGALQTRVRLAADENEHDVPSGRSLPQPSAEEGVTGCSADVYVAEGFRSGLCSPLIVKGRVDGVLEVFFRAPREIDDEWRDYLEMLAGQLAIAIDNRALFSSLERSNQDLARAYDTTLEGWSRALEQRDRETQGHSARVVELSALVGKAMGMSEAELVSLRRGALLHDIGKMGIPDSILLKPGPLDPDEWAVMRRHPEIAHDLLAPIEFLQDALDVPYCHHERWDGSGYPRGLRGEEIPLAARIFAVVDAWDGLSYARPYHEAWTREDVRAHLLEQAGAKFDPEVVRVFLEVVG